VGRAPKLEKFVKKNVYNYEFPYRKAVSCPDCKHLLLGSASRGRLGKYYPAYHCSHHGHYFRVSKKDFDTTINDFAQHVMVSPERFDEVMQAVLTVWEKKQAQAQTDVENRARRREELEAEIKVIVDKMKIISSATAIKYMEVDLVKLEQEIANLETKKEEKAVTETVDMPTMLTYVKYFVEHLKDLLFDHCNPVLKAKYFSVIFDQVPTYAEIQCGSANISQIPGVNELFKLAHSKNISLVRERGLEPPQDYSHYHLKVACLPFHHSRI
jgi:site-specific DNA recombinase